jgi:hypothetical protein
MSCASATDSEPRRLSSASGERAFVERLRRLLPAAPTGQQWIGDDAAVLDDGLFFKTDVMVRESTSTRAGAIPKTSAEGACGEPLGHRGDGGHSGGSSRGPGRSSGPTRDGRSDDDRTGDRREPTRVSHRRRGHLERTSIDGRGLRSWVVPEAGPVLRSGARPGDIIVVTANSAPPRRPLPACAEAMLRLLDSSGCDAPSLVWPKESPPGRSARPR